MRKEQWHKIVEIFEQALDLSGDERSRFLNDICGGDLRLQEEVEAMLAADSDALDFIESPFIDKSSLSLLKTLRSDNPLSDLNPEDDLGGMRIGAFRLVSELGRGGMGTVFLAERVDGEFEQQAAIKLIKRGMDSEFIIKRFRHERQILANLEHPNIARLFDGGTALNGLPYLIMEFIEGSTIYDYCDAVFLTIRERLKLFVQICSAVSFAHSKQVIHRDIKPNNILVTNQGVPKLLDFGIAKILDPDMIHESVSPTGSMMRLLTPDYASPEQIRGDDVSPASDIYSLGILLFELLTGHRPFNLSKLSFYEVSRIICEDPPEIPSDVFSRQELLRSVYDPSQNGKRDLAGVRRSTIDGLKEELFPNLDNLIIKALAKDPADRYADVDDLSEDISKHLRGEKVPIRYHLPAINSISSAALKTKSLAVLPFRLMTFGPSDDTGEKFLGLGLADAITTRLSMIRRFAVRPTSSVVRADAENSDPIRAGRELGVEYLLEGTIKRANDRLRLTVQLLDIEKNSTVWAASIDETIGDIFALEDAISKKVTEALLPHLTENELEQFSKRGTNIAEAYEHYLRGRYYFNMFTEEGLAKAIVSFHSAIAEDPKYAHAYAGIADYYNWLGIFGVLPPQECFRAGIEAAEKAVALDDQLAEAHTSLAFGEHAGNFDWVKAEIHFLRSLELKPNNVTNFTWLAILRFTEEKFVEGIKCAKRAIELDPFSAFSHHNLGWGLYFARRYEDCIEQYKKVTQEFPDYGLGFYGLSKVLRFVGRFDESLTAIDRAIDLFENSDFVVLARIETLAASGNIGEAESQLKEFNSTVGERFVSPHHLALIYCYLGKTDNAIDCLNICFEIGDAWLNWMNVEPVFDRLAGEPRFVKMRKMLGQKINRKELSDDKLLRNLSDPVNDQTDENKDQTSSVRIDQATSDDKETLLIHNTATLSGPGRLAAVFKKRWFKLAGIIGPFLIMIFGLYWTDTLTFSLKAKPNTAATAKSMTMVVLPFTSDDQADQNKGISIAESLSGKLGNINRLTVISANSGRAVASKNTDEIARELGVGFILRGSIYSVNDRDAISAELIAAADGRSVWKETFESNGSLIEAQTLLAEKIWSTLEIEPSPFEIQQIRKRLTENQAAYELFLLGRYQMTNRSPENLSRAINTFLLARDADPNFVLPYVGLADAYALQNLYAIPPPPDGYAKAKQNALHALKLDGDLAEAHASLAYIKFYGDRDRTGAELEFRRAIQINPSYAAAHHWFALVLAAMNNQTESISEARIAQKLDPLSPSIKAANAITYFYNRQYQEALAEAEKALRIDPGFVPAYKVKRWVYQARGEYEPAMNAFLREKSLSGGENSPGWYVVQAQIEALGENRAQSLQKLEDAVSSESVKANFAAYAYEIALAYTAFGLKNKALESLEKALAHNNYSANFLSADPRLEPLHIEARFKQASGKLKSRAAVP